jgi:hypothetical protein
LSKGESLPGIPAGGMKSAKINWQLNNAWLGINPYLIKKSISRERRRTRRIYSR